MNLLFRIKMWCYLQDLRIENVLSLSLSLCVCVSVCLCVCVSVCVCVCVCGIKK